MTTIRYASFHVLSATKGGVGSGGALRKSAHRADFSHIKAREGFIYVRSRAISSRTNDNFDTFPAAEIKAAWRSFIGKPVFVNHHNDDPSRARGVIVAAELHEDISPDGLPDTWAEVLMEVDAVRFPKLAKMILDGDIDRTSMGCSVAMSKCSFCGNEAESPIDFCQHIKTMKGRRIQRTTASGTKEAVLVSEICMGISFFENSLLVETPADPTASAFLDPDLNKSHFAKAASVKTAAFPGIEQAVPFVTAKGKTVYMIDEANAVVARSEDGRQVGYISWYYADGTINNLDVRPEWQRQGIATELFRRAHAIDPEIAHSQDRLSNDATAWIKSLPPQFQTTRKASRSARGQIMGQPRTAALDWADSLHIDSTKVISVSHPHHEALDEQIAPPKVDTLRDSMCAVCGAADSLSDGVCQTCGFEEPTIFGDPDTITPQIEDMRNDDAVPFLQCTECSEQFPTLAPEKRAKAEEEATKAGAEEFKIAVLTGYDLDGSAVSEDSTCPSCGEGTLVPGTDEAPDDEVFDERDEDIDPDADVDAEGSDVDVDAEGEPGEIKDEADEESDEESDEDEDNKPPFKKKPKEKSVSAGRRVASEQRYELYVGDGDEMPVAYFPTSGEAFDAAELAGETNFSVVDSHTGDIVKENTTASLRVAANPSTNDAFGYFEANWDYSTAKDPESLREWFWRQPWVEREFSPGFDGDDIEWDAISRFYVEPHMLERGASRRTASSTHATSTIKEKNMTRRDRTARRDAHTPYLRPRTAGFWDEIKAQVDRISKAKSVTEVLNILNDPTYTESAAYASGSGDAFFGGSGGDDNLFEALSDAGWKVTSLESDYYFVAVAPNGEVLTYIEGDVYRGNKAASRRTAMATCPECGGDIVGSSSSMGLPGHERMDIFTCKNCGKVFLPEKDNRMRDDQGRLLTSHRRTAALSWRPAASFAGVPAEGSSATSTEGYNYLLTPAAYGMGGTGSWELRRMDPGGMSDWVLLVSGQAGASESQCREIAEKDAASPRTASLQSAHRRTAISLTNIGKTDDPLIFTGKDPSGKQVKFKVTKKESDDLKAIMYSDMAINFSGVDVDESEIVKDASFRRRAGVNWNQYGAATINGYFVPTALGGPGDTWYYTIYRSFDSSDDGQEIAGPVFVGNERETKAAAEAAALALPPGPSTQAENDGAFERDLRGASRRTATDDWDRNHMHNITGETNGEPVPCTDLNHCPSVCDHGPDDCDVALVGRTAFRQTTPKENRMSHRRRTASATLMSIYADGFGNWHAQVIGGTEAEAQAEARRAIIEELADREGPNFDPGAMTVVLDPEKSNGESRVFKEDWSRQASRKEPRMSNHRRTASKSTFSPCEAHKDYWGGMSKSKMAKDWVEGGPTNGKPCSPGLCQSNPGTDYYNESSLEDVKNNVVKYWSVNKGRTANRRRTAARDCVWTYAGEDDGGAIHWWDCATHDKQEMGGPPPSDEPSFPCEGWLDENRTTASRKTPTKESKMSAQENRRLKAAIAVQARRVQSQQERIDTLTDVLREVIAATGVRTPKAASLVLSSEDKNGDGSVAETDEQALPESTDVESEGKVIDPPPPVTNDDPSNEGGTLADDGFNKSDDPESVGSGDGITNESDSERTFTSMRLARLRIEAGVEEGDDLMLGQQIANSTASMDSIRNEVATLTKVVAKNASREASRPRGVPARVSQTAGLAALIASANNGSTGAMGGAPGSGSGAALIADTMV